MIFTFAKVLINVATAIDEAYYEGKENEVENMVLSSDQKLETMDIDNLTVCNQTAEINDFLIKDIEKNLKNNYLQNDFEIIDVIIRKNCSYLKVMHDIPFKGGNKCYGTSFSINIMEVNNGVSVYGHKTKNTNEKLVFKEIANELLKAVS
ncbi:hypothetical protein BXU11_08050 [Flavobacterium sp. LM5]|uniref:hypothetical protein n=1 Tax=Flavobacterium sp. LM5 TaxID=1938610 RepID=UPI0009940295|nr:hypothetical protein [Flavobacterium sp. LM5]OOV29807.1 hypothetical protein BXU11_08050 [Flavobacterium sp. LM5]